MNSPPFVRAMRRDDLPHVWAMLRDFAEFERMTDILTGSVERLESALFGVPRHLFGLVAERQGGALAGYALYHFTFSSFRTNPRMWLEDLYVDPSARGTGAGEALLAAFCRHALDEGCHRVDWHVLDWNPARGFYERMGARESDEGLIQMGLDAASMRALVERMR